MDFPGSRTSSYKTETPGTTYLLCLFVHDKHLLSINFTFTEYLVPRDLGDKRVESEVFRSVIKHNK